MNRRNRSIVGLLMVVLVLAGCGGADAGPKVATAASPTAAGPAGTANPTSTPSKESDYDKALRYTRCMNDNGQKMDDPVEGKPLPIMGTNNPPGNGWTKVPEAFDKCKHLLPATWPVKVDPKDIARERPFAECMRQHGIDYPEPDANGMVRYPADPSTLGASDYQAAEAACRYLIDDPANNAGDR